MDIWLSTTDNPYNPIEDYDAWNTYDTQKGYHTPEFIDRLLTARGVDLSQFSDADERSYLESLIDDVVKNTRAYTPLKSLRLVRNIQKVLKFINFVSKSWNSSK